MRNGAARGLSAAWPAVLATALLLTAIYFGSGRLQYLDRSLLGYGAASIVAVYATAYQVGAFWRRRPSAFYGRVLLGAMARPRQLWRVVRAAGRDLAAQRFLARRSPLRWLAHMLLAWGTMAGFGVTLPLVWGWFRFEAAGEHRYEAELFSLPLGNFSTEGVFGWLVFHALHLAAAAVVLGATYFLVARARRRRESGVVDPFHLAPLLLLLVVALTGLALPAAAHAGHAWFRLAAIAHEATVVTLLVTLPYGKLIHLFIRPLHLGAQLMRAQSRSTACCRSCHAPMAPTVQLEGIERMLAARGFRFAGHQQLCPGCRRRQLAAVHGHLLGARFQPQPTRRRAVLRQAA